MGFARGVLTRPWNRWLRPAYTVLMRWTTIGAALMSVCVVLSGCAGVGYVLKESGPFIHYSFGAQNVDAVLSDPRTTSDVKELLQRVKDIKRYAVETVGLADNGNYTAYKPVDRDYLVDVVSGCDATSFTPYQWSYPLLGKLPYRGFYDPADAHAEADALKAQGLDVIVRKVDAFSTLGFFKDPVYSFFSTYGLYELADTIIHEQTHATLFLTGQDDFNEELATFVGDTAGLAYVASIRGTDSAEYRDAVAEQSDEALFVEFLRDLKGALQDVYGSDLTAEEKLAKKKDVIARFQSEFETSYASRFSSNAYRSAKDLPLNNAYLSLYDLYTNDIPLLRRFYTEKCGGDVKQFMAEMLRLSKAPGDMFDKVRTALQAGV